jgi:hypothetical protein
LEAGVDRSQHGRLIGKGDLHPAQPRAHARHARVVSHRSSTGASGGGPARLLPLASTQNLTSAQLAFVPCSILLRMVIACVTPKASHISRMVFSTSSGWPCMKVSGKPPTHRTLRLWRTSPSASGDAVLRSGIHFTFRISCARAHTPTRDWSTPARARTCPHTGGNAQPSHNVQTSPFDFTADARIRCSRHPPARGSCQTN